MSDSEIQRMIRQEVTRHLNILLPGVSQNSTGQVEDILNMYPGMDAITRRPTMRPYGVVSRAPKGTTQVTARMGAHPGNRMVVGHRDASAPVPAEEGDSILYHKLLSQVQALKDKIVLLRSSGFTFVIDDAALKAGKAGDTETLVAGETLVQCLSAIVDWAVAHTHITGAPGGPTSAPLEATDLNSIKAQFISNAKILMKSGGRY